MVATTRIVTYLALYGRHAMQRPVSVATPITSRQGSSRLAMRPVRLTSLLRSMAGIRTSLSHPPTRVVQMEAKPVRLLNIGLKCSCKYSLPVLIEDLPRPGLYVCPACTKKFCVTVEIHDELSDT